MAADLLTFAENIWADFYWEQWSTGTWAALSDDDRSYGQRHLGEHLDAAGAPYDRLKALVDVSWRDAWQSHDPTFEGFLNDIELAWKRSGDDLELAVKCCLCRASVVAQRATMPETLLRLALRHGLVSPKEALVIVRRTPDPTHRSMQLTTLVPHVADDAIPDIASAAYDLVSSYDKARVLAAVVPRADKQLRQRIYAGAMKLERPRDRAHVLGVLLSAAPDDLRPTLTADFLSAAGQIDLSFDWRDVLLNTIQNLPAVSFPDVLDEVISFARRSKSASDGHDIAQVVIACAQRAEGSNWIQIIKTIQSMKSDFSVANTLGDVADRLPNKFAQEAFGVANALTNPEARLLAVTALEKRPGGRGESVSEVDEKEAASTFTRKISEALENEKPYTLFPALIREAPSELFSFAFEKALAALEMAQNDYEYISSAKGLYQNLPDVASEAAAELRDKMLGKLKDVEHNAGRIGDLISVAALLQMPDRRPVLKRAIEAIPGIHGDEAQVSCLKDVADVMPADFLELAVQVARQIPDTEKRAEALIALTERAPERDQKALVIETLKLFERIDDPAQQGELLVTIAPHVPPPDRNRILNHAIECFRVFAPRKRFAILTSDPNAPDSDAHLIAAKALEAADSDGRLQLQRAAVNAACTLPIPSFKAGALAALAPLVNDAEWPRLMQVAEDLKHDDGVRILTALAAAQDPISRQLTLRKALNLILFETPMSLSALSQHPPGPQVLNLVGLFDDATLSFALDLAIELVQSDWYLGAILQVLAPYLSKKDRRKALTVAKRLGSERFETTTALEHPPDPKPWQTREQFRRRVKAPPSQPPSDADWHRTLALPERVSDQGFLRSKTPMVVEQAVQSGAASHAVVRERLGVTLHQISRERRPMALRMLVELHPLFRKLYREDEPKRVAEAIIAVCSWWP